MDRSQTIVATLDIPNLPQVPSSFTELAGTHFAQVAESVAMAMSTHLGQPQPTQRWQQLALIRQYLLQPESLHLPMAVVVNGQELRLAPSEIATFRQQLLTHFLSLLERQEPQTWQLLERLHALEAARQKDGQVKVKAEIGRTLREIQPRLQQMTPVMKGFLLDAIGLDGHFFVYPEVEAQLVRLLLPNAPVWVAVDHQLASQFLDQVNHSIASYQARPFLTPQETKEWQRLTQIARAAHQASSAWRLPRVAGSAAWNAPVRAMSATSRVFRAAPAVVREGVVLVLSAGTIIGAAAFGGMTAGLVAALFVFALQGVRGLNQIRGGGAGVGAGAGPGAGGRPIVEPPVPVVAPIRVQITGWLRQLADNQAVIDQPLAANETEISVMDLISRLEARFVNLRDRLVNDEGQLRHGIQVFVNGQAAGLNALLGPGHTVGFVGALAGGNQGKPEPSPILLPAVKEEPTAAGDASLGPHIPQPTAAIVRRGEDIWGGEALRLGLRPRSGSRASEASRGAAGPAALILSLPQDEGGALVRRTPDGAAVVVVAPESTELATQTGTALAPVAPLGLQQAQPETPQESRAPPQLTQPKRIEPQPLVVTLIDARAKIRSMSRRLAEDHFNNRMQRVGWIRQIFLRMFASTNRANTSYAIEAQLRHLLDHNTMPSASWWRHLFFGQRFQTVHPALAAELGATAPFELIRSDESQFAKIAERLEQNWRLAGEAAPKPIQISPTLYYEITGLIRRYASGQFNDQEFEGRLRVPRMTLGNRSILGQRNLSILDQLRLELGNRYSLGSNLLQVAKSVKQHYQPDQRLDNIQFTFASPRQVDVQATTWIGCSVCLPDESPYLVFWSRHCWSGLS
ncbi:MAG: hypothetical protein HYT88_03870 [Candidatus Omnitrophica bacterium]|nr:hypothetical protein [Candidatus Omnitrophota bacterium]